MKPVDDPVPARQPAASDAATEAATDGSGAGDLAIRLTALHVYPVKSCAGVALTESLLIETGLEFDRAWMLVDPAGRFVSQREWPRLALVRPTLRSRDMVLRAPGMLALHLALDAVEAACRVTIWRDQVAAFDMGALAAQWFSDFIGAPLRLVRFDPAQQRLSSRRWSGDIAAENAFSDGYPLLVASVAGLAELNRRLAAAGQPAVTMARFRPNLVIDGAADGALPANGEDHLDEIAFDSAQGPVRLRLVKPCRRCPIPDVDPDTGVPGHAVGDALAGYRADPRLDGAVSFGMNAVIVGGIDCLLQAGSVGRATWKFD